MRGDFMLTVLFKSYLLLATTNPGTSKYTTIAIISLGDARIENTDNGRGDISNYRHFSATLLTRY